MLYERDRYWPSIKPTLAYCLLCAGRRKPSENKDRLEDKEVGDQGGGRRGNLTLITTDPPHGF